MAMQWSGVSNPVFRTAPEHWAQHVWRECQDDFKALKRSDVCHPTRVGTDMVIGLSVSEVLQHVQSQFTGDDPVRNDQLMVEAAQACYRTQAARQTLAAALTAQERLDELHEILRGRRSAGRPVAGDCDAIERVRCDLYSQVTQALNEWRDKSQRFTRRVRLLPSQLRSDQKWPKPMKPGDGVAWSGSDENLLSRLEVAYIEAVALRQLVVSQFHEAKSHRLEAEDGFSRGGTTGSRFAACILGEYVQFASVQHAEAQHAEAHFKLSALVLGCPVSASA